MNINVLKSKSGIEVNGPILITPDIITDSRGFFYESWNQKKFDKLLGKNIIFVQDNHSKSQRGVLRGLHYQIPNLAQAKLIRCTSGMIFDVAVDLRKSSPTFKKYVSVVLDDINKSMFWIPKGFAHGFLTLSQTAEVEYKTTDYWSKAHERTINWNDPTLNIEWPYNSLKDISFSLNDRDFKAPLFEDLNWDIELFN